MEPIQLPDPQQLEALAERLRPLLFKLAGAQAGQDLEISIAASAGEDGVTLRLELKLDGQDLPPEQEAKIGLFFQRMLSSPV